MKIVKVNEDITLKIDLDMGITLNFQVEKNQEFQYVGKFKNNQDGKELIAIRKDEEGFIFAVEREKIQII